MHCIESGGQLIWDIFDVEKGSICSVNDIKQVYVRLEDKNNHQIWQVVNEQYLKQYCSNYFVKSITQTLPSSGKDDDIVFYNNTIENTLELMVYDSSIQTQNKWKVYEVKDGSICTVENEDSIYVKYSNKDGHQYWAVYHRFDPSTTINLTETNT